MFVGIWELCEVCFALSFASHLAFFFFHHLMPVKVVHRSAGSNTSSHLVFDWTVFDLRCVYGRMCWPGKAVVAGSIPRYSVSPLLMYGHYEVEMCNLIFCWNVESVNTFTRLSSFVLYVLVVPHDFACVQVAINVIQLKQTEWSVGCFVLQGPAFVFCVPCGRAGFYRSLLCVFFFFFFLAS